ncbi:response regulator [Candidatus Saccharibacteria bacterium]|nr:response regulator [Candidatus Saccharibacteria bacterium]
MIFVIDSDVEMAECVALACEESGHKVKIFHNAIEAMQALSSDLPELIFLDIMLTGPDGFSFLNEMISYTDTARVPVVIVSGVDFKGVNLDIYGVVGVLNKDTMKPEDVKKYVAEFAR